MSESSIKARLSADLKEAMKAKDEFLRDTIRMLNAAIKQVEVDTREVLDDAKVIKILKTAYKQRQDAAESYKEAGRADLFERESKEMEVILRYLPQQLSDAELESKLKEIIAQVGASSPKDMGKVMGASKALSEVADGRRISEMVKTLLNQLG
ncbi:glutamyl-tRNA amidotransferase [Helicobacter sp. CLO-3]|uniref:GatB/YqeY domain-containing protein n=1 Tax=unclassified Helicobacter TaxID=2593540 RepID=UPI000804CDBC|nr:MULTISPECIES: GatB/YqeY domain-containing protein [unclassified Helicobacter]OBV29632.1 glutamyl-tRNA amidotransferase [Helicobacter sp. CLO-3]OHU85602.1 glutamyl-tRNA amidotransferase [Helicobacter sp. CLO-3]